MLDDSTQSQSNFELISVRDLLLSRKFVVPAYQRGYKWSKTPVEMLLDDIDKFKPSGDSGEFYCLQPVVGKKQGDSWELIDGQQRITTIWIILIHLRGPEPDDANELHDLKYNTREGSSDFLRKLKHDFGVGLGGTDDDNIDIFHFKSACETIKDWFEKKGTDERLKWKGKLLDHTKVIWYDVGSNNDPRDDPKEVFRRLNSGKIPLTSGELIKALFLVKTDSNVSTELFSRRQSQIAREWDEIENALQNEDFWQFLNGGIGKPLTSRIEFIFNLIHKNIGGAETSYYEYILDKKETNPENFHNEVPQLWQKVKHVYYTIREWYEDDTLHSRVGFLLSCRKAEDVQSIYKLTEKRDDEEFATKSEFLVEIKKSIKKKIPVQPIKDTGIHSEEGPQYGEDNDAIHNMLLWFNIFTSEKSKTRYPFLSYHYITQNGGWSLEHIHAQQSQELDDKEWKPYAESALNILKDQGIEICPKLEKQVKQSEPGSNDEIRRQIDVIIEENVGSYGENGIDNIALLGRNQNSSLNNKVFSDKREEIRKKEREGNYIPLSTIRVFSKYYSKTVRNLYKWSSEDKEGYLEALKESLEEFSTDSNQDNDK